MNHVELIEGLEVAVAALVEKMAICDFYAGIYFGVQLHSKSKGDSQQLRIILDTALPELYAAVIVFAVKARSYFEGGGMYLCGVNFILSFVLNQLGWKNLLSAFKSFNVELAPLIKEIEGQEGKIRECADLATMQRIQSILLLFFLPSPPPFFIR